MGNDVTKLVITFLTIALLLGIGVGGFTVYQYYNINIAPDQFDEKEFKMYQQTMASQEPECFNTVDDMNADTVDEGMYVQFRGVVEDIKQNLLVFKNGIKCYFIEGALDMKARDKVLAMMNDVEVGSVVTLEGMVSQVEDGDISIKYCDVPDEEDVKIDPNAPLEREEASEEADSENSITISKSDIKMLELFGFDTWSKRASMAVEHVKNDVFRVSVKWANSANESVYWDMTATYDPDSQTLSYDDCKRSIIGWDENGDEYKETVYTNGKGKFRLDEKGYLSWESENDDSVNECLFEQMVKLGE